ncbi:hypothetical protein MJO28_013169, partial [Puccinia striiformis f. sp. tritici]
MTSNQLALVNRLVGDVGDDLEGILKLLNRIEHSHQLGYSYQVSYTFISLLIFRIPIILVIESTSRSGLILGKLSLVLLYITLTNYLRLCNKAL